MMLSDENVIAFPQPPGFNIETLGSLINVKIHGQWTLQADLEYLTELAYRMQSMRGKPWAMLVDMRGWVMPDEVIHSEAKSKQHLDRRNQRAECWIVDDPHQGDFLLQYFNQVPLGRFMTPAEASVWLANKGFRVPTEVLANL